MIDTMMGVDLAKRVFRLNVASMTGEVRDRKKLTPDQFRRYMSVAPKCIVVFEACGSAHYWSREMMALGHEARIIPAQDVKPFVKCHKMEWLLRQTSKLSFTAGRFSVLKSPLFAS